jgi:hypothetical protein
MLPGGRTPKSCEQLGEDPANVACLNFRPRGSAGPPDELAPAREVQRDIDRPVDWQYDQEFYNVLAENLTIERDATNATNKIKDELVRLDVPVAFSSPFPRYVSKLSDLRLLHALVGMMSLDVYRDQIMSSEINKMFGIVPKPKEPDHAGVLRALHDGPGTGLDPAGGREARDAPARDLAAERQPQGPAGRSGRPGTSGPGPTPGVRTIGPRTRAR